MIDINDNDDDLVIIHTKRMLTEEKLRQENRQLSEMNRRLETEKDEYQTKLEVFEGKRKAQIAKLNTEIQVMRSIDLISELNLLLFRHFTVHVNLSQMN